MLFSLYPKITQNYFILCFVVTLGVLQWSAARNHCLSLSLLGLWGFSRRGKIFGLLLIIGGLSWFFAFTPGLFEPGLAGGELSPLFGLGGACALVTARLSGAFWQKSR